MGWTRRVRWYHDIRLEFQNEEQVWNKIYTDPGIAQIEYDLFRRGHE